LTSFFSPQQDIAYSSRAKEALGLTSMQQIINLKVLIDMTLNKCLGDNTALKLAQRVAFE
jgi:hypothetical protein